MHFASAFSHKKNYRQRRECPRQYSANRLFPRLPMKWMTATVVRMTKLQMENQTCADYVVKLTHVQAL